MTKRRLAFLVLIAMFGIGLARWQIKSRDDQIDAILRRMELDGQSFDPTELNSHGVQGTEIILERLLQRTAVEVGYEGYFHISSNFADGFSVYVKQISDDERLAVLARGAVTGFAAGRPYGDRRQILRAAVHAVVQSRNDRLIDLLRPLLNHPAWEVPAMLLNEVRLVRQDGNNYYPSIYFAALASKNPRIVEEALNWAPNCWDEPKRRPLRDALRRVFLGANEELKFQSCFPLMYEFRDRPAIDYLVVQTRSTNRERVERAILWLGDTCNNRWSPAPGVRDALLAHINSADAEMRRGAVGALGTYPGREALEIIVTLIADADPQVAAEAQRSLSLRMRPRNRDFALLRELLVDQAGSSEDAMIRELSRSMLEQMAANERNELPNDEQ